MEHRKNTIPTITQQPLCQVPVVQKLNNTIHWINLYAVNKTIGFLDSYPMDSDLSGG